MVIKKNLSEFPYLGCFRATWLETQGLGLQKECEGVTEAISNTLKTY